MKNISWGTEFIKLGFQRMNRFYLVFFVACLTLSANASAQSAFVACAYKKTDEVIKTLDEYLNCEVLAHEAARVYGDGCKHSLLTAFSCKRRGGHPAGRNER